MARWKREKPPGDGDRRVAWRFLWKPLCLGIECRKWETVGIRQVFSYAKGGWQDIAWAQEAE